MTPAPSPGGPTSLRPARPDDVPAIQAIYAHHVLGGVASFEEVPPDAAEMARRMEAVAALGLPFLVAEREGGVRGYAYANRWRERSAYRYAVEDSVYVDPAWLRLGIGAALLEALIATCRGLGLRRMVAVIGDSRNVASIGLHAGQGFRVSGVLPSIGYKHGRWVDAVLMTRGLGEGDRSPPG